MKPLFQPILTTAILLISLFWCDQPLTAACPTPSFVTTGPFNVGSSPVAVAVGDFNGDLQLDMAVANQQSANISVLLATSGGGFQDASNYVAGTFPQSVAVGD